MEKITILNSHRDSFEVDVLRYFIMGNASILLYTLNESDEDGNVRLYVTKIINGTTQALTDEEWTLVKASIRTIVSENREGKPLTVRDLNYKEIEGLVVEHLKVFKLAGDVLGDLGANKKKYEEEKAPSVIPVSSVNAIYTPSYINPQAAVPTQPVAPTPVAPVMPRGEEDFINEATRSFNPTVEQPVTVDYKAMYEEIEKERKRLEEELFDLQSKTLSYQIKYDQIRKILEGGNTDEGTK